MNTLKLYQIRRDIEEALIHIDIDKDGVMTEESAATVSGLEREFVEKVRNCAGFVKNCQSEAEILDDEITSLRRRRDALSRQAKGTAEYVKDEMEHLGMKRLLAGTHRVVVANNPAGVEVTDEEALGDEWKETVVEIKIRKREIVRFYKVTGEMPEGCELKEGTHLRVN